MAEGPIESLTLNPAGKRDGAWFFVKEPGEGKYVQSEKIIVAKDGQVLTKRPHGFPHRIEALNESGMSLPPSTYLRAVGAVGHAMEKGGVSEECRVQIRMTAGEQEVSVFRGTEGENVVEISASWLHDAPSHHVVNGAVERALEEHGFGETGPASLTGLPEKPTSRVLFFEALMNTDSPHNHTEISQGVLHMASPLAELETEVVLVDVKMPITGTTRPVWGMENLENAVGGAPIGLVCMTLLEGYWDGAIKLITELRRLGCRARIALGGVMPTHTPEHVAAHFPEVSFVCRGAGEGIVRRLAEILGDSDVDTPLTAAQREALLTLDGIIGLERQEGVITQVLSANSRHTNVVEDLDKAPLDLDLIKPRHLVNGVEMCTSRGCIWKCSFCTIMGRQTYQSRTSENLIDLLGRYEEYYHSIFDGEIPRNAFKLHLSDDDFACDKPRAAQFFKDILSTPFRLSSVQVAIGDLCRKEGGKVLPEPDHEFLDTIRPECFFHSQEEIPEDEFIHDQHDRRWSAYLQIGVETFTNQEIARLGKGYKRAHIRTIAAELDRRGIHFTCYFILANMETTAEDLIENLEEVARLKLRFPKTFHIKYPLVERLVSVFPSATYRKALRMGKESEALSLRSHAQEEGYPEFDYPFVDYDIPLDPWVHAVLGQDLFTDEHRYLGSLEILKDKWTNRMDQLPADDPERKVGERLLRRLHDRYRRLVFDYLLHARDTAEPHVGWPEHLQFDEPYAISVATDILGDPEGWRLPLKRFAQELHTPRMVVIPTWQCELRCGYCFIPKQEGRVMDRRTLERSVDMLIASEQKDLILQFFGGEALLEYENVRYSIEYAQAQARQRKKSIHFILSTNGWSLSEERLEWLKTLPVKLELSLDGAERTQTRFRPAGKWIGGNSYESSIVPTAKAIQDSGIPYDVIMVVHPKAVDDMAENFFHIADMGFRRIQVNFALGFRWKEEQKQSFAAQLMVIGKELRQRWARGEQLDMVNLDGRPMKMRLNAEITVDWDGTVYGGNGFLHETENKEKFRIGHLDDLKSFDTYRINMPTNEFLLDWSYPDQTTENNLAVGAIYTSWIKWMQKQPVNPFPQSPPRANFA